MIIKKKRKEKSGKKEKEKRGNLDNDEKEE